MTVYKLKSKKELFLAAFSFVSNYGYWQAITALAKHILAQSKAILHYELMLRSPIQSRVLFQT